MKTLLCTLAADYCSLIDSYLWARQDMVAVFPAGMHANRVSSDVGYFEVVHGLLPASHAAAFHMDPCLPWQHRFSNRG